MLPSTMNGSKGGTLMFDVTNLGHPNASVQNDFSNSIIAIVLAFLRKEG